MAKLSQAFYEQPTLDLARSVLGKTLMRASPEGLSGGVIVEVEAYICAIDPAAHGFQRETPRTRIMYGPPGHAYLYFNYGMHWMLNISSEPDRVGGAVLLRAIQPTVGLELIRQRRGEAMPLRDLARGPGRICAALGLGKGENGMSFTSETLWLEDEPGLAPEAVIATSGRIGITKGTDLPWRLYLAGNPYVSGTNGARMTAH